MCKGVGGKMYKKLKNIMCLALMLLVLSPFILQAEVFGSLTGNESQRVFKLKSYKIDESRGDLIIGDFEGSTDGWVNGPNVSELRLTGDVAAKPAPANGKGILILWPAGGNKTYSMRTVYKEFKEPLNVTGKNVFVASINSYGFKAEYDNKYRMYVRFYTKDDSRTYIIRQQLEPWYKVAIDLSDWEGIKEITKIEIASWTGNEGEGENWGGVYFLDYLGFIRPDSGNIEIAPGEYEIKQSVASIDDFKSMSQEQIQKILKEKIKASVVIQTGTGKVIVNGDVKAAGDSGAKEVIVKDGTIMASLELLASILGIEYSEGSEADRHTVSMADRKVYFTTGSYKIKANDTDKVFDACPVLDNGVIYVPLANMAEDLGKHVNIYDEGLIIINDTGEVFDRTLEKPLIDLLSK